MAVSALAWAEAHGADARRLTVHATDIDAKALERAAAARFTASAFIETAPEIRDRWFAPGEPATARPDVTERLQVARRDLLLEGPPADGLAFVACRNVLIYFEREAQDALLGRIRQALRPGGMLLLGKVESLLGEARGWFDVVDARERLFRRPP
jgi:chemotaxis methyl-accepting protein methylase